MATSAAFPNPGQGSLPRVAFLDAQNELPMIEISTPWSTAEVYLLGAHVTSFKKLHEPPLLFVSQCSRFAEGQPIRGGIPVIFPWFGPREGLPQHGYARIKTWDLKELVHTPEGGVTARFRLPDCPEASGFPRHSAEYTITVRDYLLLQLSIKNESPDETFAFEDCLHTYFEVGDVTAASVSGLAGLHYLDKVARFAEAVQGPEPIRITSEVDRIYLDAPGPVEIVDARLGRRIRVEKQGSASTVVWNPWIAKSQQMPDFCDGEYTQMLCVESGNVSRNEIRLAPGETSTLTVKLSTEPL